MTPGCNDCGMEFTCSRYEHDLVCEAKTCAVCLNTYPTPVKMNDAGERVCNSCAHEMDAGSMDRSSEEEDDDGAA
jgi:hypothetical protein